MSQNLLIIFSLMYTGLLFAIAYYADRAARRNQKPFWLGSPLIYTLSLSVYCTAWTFYGAVGSAARSGIEFLAIYIGPSLMFFAYWIILRRVVRIGHQQNITSVADFLSSRFGKSNGIAVLATLLSVLATTPYISLQLQSITQSYAVFFAQPEGQFNFNVVAFAATIMLSVFAIIFGTRHARVNERHHGVVVAIALESLVKLAAVLIVGGFLIVSFGGFDVVFSSEDMGVLLDKPVFTTRWFSLVSVSFMAVLVLPRMFHVIVVENENENDVFTASWAFPLYLLLLNIFVLPIAVIGLNMAGEGVNPDYYLITLPLMMDHEGLALLAYIGGVSAATSMIIVTAIAVATMISNHIAMPLWLDARGEKDNPEDVSRAILYVRRVAIFLIMLLGFLYFEIAGNSPSLASVGLIAFVGVAQLFPSMMAALFWRGATKTGAISAIVIGGVLWGYTLFLPSLGGYFASDAYREGLFGIYWLAPNALFGMEIADSAVHAIFWSLLFNTLALFMVSILSRQRPFERLQANHFVDVFDTARAPMALQRESDIHVEDFFVLGQRVFGGNAEEIFSQIADAQGRSGREPVVNDFFIDRFERAMGGVLGGAAAHALITQLVGSGSVPVSETIKLADETVQNIEYAKALEAQRKELESTAQALRDANSSLVALDAQKDAFLSQISHELRTPMTAIRSFTDILREGDISPAQTRKMLDIIARENHRLTELLDDILDLSYLESGRVRMATEPHDLREILEHSIRATEPVWQAAGIEIKTEAADEPQIALCDYNRLSQIFINLISNTAKYARAHHPQLLITIREAGTFWHIDFQDNGPGIAAKDREAIFEKFSRGGASDIAGSAGLGLAISREIAENMQGQLELIPSRLGACFRVVLRKAGA